jgi:hypothetical protein
LLFRFDRQGLTANVRCHRRGQSLPVSTCCRMLTFTR